MPVDLTQVASRSAISILDERTLEDRARIESVEKEQVRQGNRLTKIETRIALYATAGAVLGGTLVDVISKHL